ncbi:hypothetical protein E5983_08980 [Streptococcus danieliae]|uniref:Replication initiation factor n=1 Tax=Streptococcus danieliae TaxID=747656 RepID=A0A7X3G9V9_9STRE|nr:replication initiation factor domain-containing protein [Streptococcus danieliae]MVX59752.1 hypothetical protein [Streptococcus danieliae]
MDESDLFCSIDRLTILAEPKNEKRLSWVHRVLKRVLMTELSDSTNLFVDEMGDTVMSPYGVAYGVRDEYGEIEFKENLIYCEILERGGYVDLRYDFNPNSLKKWDVEWVWNVVRNVLDEFGSEYRLSRFDLAIDVINTPEIFELKCTRQGVTRKLLFGRSGALETIYWGSRQSDVQVRLYNKLKEMKSYERAELDESIKSFWRLEMQMRTKKIDRTLAQEFSDRLDGFSLVPVSALDLKPELKRFAMLLESDGDVAVWYPEVDERTLRRWKAKVRKAREDFDDDAYRKVLKNALHNQMQDIKSELDKYVDVYLGF